MKPPTHGANTKHVPIEEVEENLLDTEVKLLQEIVGVFLHYARAIDNTMIFSTNNLALAQTKGTSETLEE